MSVEQEQQWITGEEFGREWRRLADASLPHDAPQFQALLARKQARDDYLYERYGKPLRAAHEGKWIAISTDGEVIIRDTAGEVLQASRDRFGPGNAAIRRLADVPGHVFYR